MVSILIHLVSYESNFRVKLIVVYYSCKCLGKGLKEKIKSERSSPGSIFTEI